MYKECLEVLNSIEKLNINLKNDDYTTLIHQHRGIIFKKLKDYDKAVLNYQISLNRSVNNISRTRTHITLINA